MVGGSWKCPLSPVEFLAWLSCKYLLLSHLYCGKTGTEIPRSLMEVDEYKAFVHLEEKHALKSNRKLICERERNSSIQLEDNLGSNIAAELNPPEPFLLECCGPIHHD